MGEAITLKQPRFASGKTVLEALENRKSTREYSSEPLSEHELSELLWAAGGINRADGHRTAPSAMNTQNIDIYVFLATGIYKYEPKKHILEPIIEGNHQKESGSQEYVATAPVNLLLVARPAVVKGKEVTPEQQDSWSYLAAAYISENVYLYCAAAGLATVARAFIDKEALKELLKLTDKEEAVLGQSVGHFLQK